MSDPGVVNRREVCGPRRGCKGRNKAESESVVLT